MPPCYAELSRPPLRKLDNFLEFAPPKGFCLEQNERRRAGAGIGICSACQIRREPRESEQEREKERGSNAMSRIGFFLPGSVEISITDIDRSMAPKTPSNECVRLTSMSKRQALNGAFESNTNSNSGMEIFRLFPCVASILCFRSLLWRRCDLRINFLSALQCLPVSLGSMLSTIESKNTQTKRNIIGKYKETIFPLPTANIMLSLGIRQKSIVA